MEKINDINIVLADKHLSLLKNDADLNNDCNQTIIKDATIVFLLNNVSGKCLSTEEALQYKELIEYYHTLYTSPFVCDDYPDELEVLKDKQLEYFLANPNCAVYSNYQKVMHDIFDEFNISYTIQENKTTLQTDELFFKVDYVNSYPTILNLLSFVKYNQDKDIKVINTLVDQSYNHALFNKGFTPNIIDEINNLGYNIDPTGDVVINTNNEKLYVDELTFHTTDATYVANKSEFLLELVNYLDIDDSLKEEIINNERR